MIDKKALSEVITRMHRVMREESVREIEKEMMVSGSIIYKHHFSCNESAGELVDDIAGVKLSDMVDD